MGERRTSGRRGGGAEREVVGDEDAGREVNGNEGAEREAVGGERAERSESPGRHTNPFVSGGDERAGAVHRERHLSFENH